jgi:hypothetical protein
MFAGEGSGGVDSCWLLGGQQPFLSGSRHDNYYLKLRSLPSRLKVWTCATQMGKLNFTLMADGRWQMVDGRW